VPQSPLPETAKGSGERPARSDGPHSTDAIIASKPAGSGSHYRWTTASKDTASGLLREKPLLNTTPDLLLAVLKKGTVSTNVYL
jgi:hypothetical protein